MNSDSLLNTNDDICNRTWIENQHRNHEKK